MEFQLFLQSVRGEAFRSVYQSDDVHDCLSYLRLLKQDAELAGQRWEVRRQGRILKFCGVI